MRHAIVAVTIVTGCGNLLGLQTVSNLAPDALDVGNECLDGSFDSIDTSVFSVGADPGVTVTASDGEVVVELAANQSGSSYGSVRALARQDLSNGMIAVEVLEAPGDHAEAALSFAMDATHKYGITLRDGTAQFYEYSDSPFRAIDQIAYGVTPPRYLRVRHRESANEIVFEISADGQQWLAASTPAAFAVTSVVCAFSAGTYASATSPGRARFDNFQVSSHTCL